MCEKVREREKERERGLQVNTVYLVMIPAMGGRHTYVISHMEKWIMIFFSPRKKNFFFFLVKILTILNMLTSGILFS